MSALEPRLNGRLIEPESDDYSEAEIIPAKPVIFNRNVSELLQKQKRLVIRPSKSSTKPARMSQAEQESSQMNLI